MSNRELAEQILTAVREELHSRNNVGWQHVDDETHDEIQDALRDGITAILDIYRPQPVRRII
jgi:hypothetical protein